MIFLRHHLSALLLEEIPDTYNLVDKRCVCT